MIDADKLRVDAQIEELRDQRNILGDRCAALRGELITKTAELELANARIAALEAAANKDQE